MVLTVPSLTSRDIAMASRKPPQKTPEKTAKKSPKAKSANQAAAKLMTTATSAAAKKPAPPKKIADKAPKTAAIKTSKPKQNKAAADAPPDSKTGASVLGEVVWLMSQSKSHQAITTGELNTRLLPAINNGQVRVFQANDKLIGAAIWAFVSATVEQRLAQNTPQLEPDDWTSGETVWLIDLIAPFGAERTMLEEMKETLFPDRAIKFRGVKDGKATIYSL